MQTNTPNVMILFGGSGDLAHRKLYPALFNLYQKNLIHENFAVIGTARRPWSDEFFREQVCAAVRETNKNVDIDAVNNFSMHFYYQSHDVTNVEHYITLKKLAQKLDQKYNAQGNRIFYMAMAPRFFGTIATHINDQQLLGDGFNRLVIEKPFGHSLPSAEKLNKEVRASFAEDSIYRIDHYLGKEMVQNILPMRLTNPLIEKIWNTESIKNIQVTLSENLGVEARGGYYDTSGALRDMVQNHIFQIITLLAMPKPKDLSSAAIHTAKQQLLDSLQMPTSQDVKEHFVRGQYDRTDDTFAYKNEPKVNLESKTETYVAGEVKFDQGPIAGVPIYFRTGKKMKEKISRIDIVLRNQNNLYGQTPENVITIIIDPKDEITFAINGKKISEKGIRQEFIDYTFSKYEMSLVPDGYERLLHDVFIADGTNFTHWSELKKYWEFIDAVEADWEKQNKTEDPRIEQYEPYKLGPDAANDIFEDPDQHWIYQ